MPIDFVPSDEEAEPWHDELLECPNGHRWESWYEFGGPYKCPACGYVVPIEIEEESTEGIGFKEGERSWCFFCDEITGQCFELDGTMNCSECGLRKWRTSYACPRCGCEETGLVESKDYRVADHPEFYGHEWEEVHKCPICGEEFEYTSADF